MKTKREKNPYAVALGRMVVEKYGREFMSKNGKKGMEVRWYGHIKKSKKDVPSENTSNTNDGQSSSQS